jgi:hypothetical protein
VLGGGEGGRSGGIYSVVAFTVAGEFRHQSAQEPAMFDVDPMRLAATTRDGLLVLDPDLAVPLAHPSFGNALTIVPEDASRDREDRS